MPDRSTGAQRAAILAVSAWQAARLPHKCHGFAPELADWLMLVAALGAPHPFTLEPAARYSFVAALELCVEECARAGLLVVTSDRYGRHTQLTAAGRAELQLHPELADWLGAALDLLADRLPVFDPNRFASFRSLAVKRLGLLAAGREPTYAALNEDLSAPRRAHAAALRPVRFALLAAIGAELAALAAHYPAQPPAPEVVHAQL